MCVCVSERYGGRDNYTREEREREREREREGGSRGKRHEIGGVRRREKRERERERRERTCRAMRAHRHRAVRKREAMRCTDGLCVCVREIRREGGIDSRSEREKE